MCRKTGQKLICINVVINNTLYMPYNWLFLFKDRARVPAWVCGAARDGKVARRKNPVRRKNSGRFIHFVDAS
jgi:hypothetical protein